MLKLRHRIISSLLFIILDIIWLKTYMSPRYTLLIEKIQKQKLVLNIKSAICAYILMLIGLNIFVLPQLDINNITINKCLLTGFLFGIIVYGVYDFTCGSIFTDWDFNLAYIDILWGGFVYFISCYILKFI